MECACNTRHTATCFHNIHCARSGAQLTMQTKILNAFPQKEEAGDDALQLAPSTTHAQVPDQRLRDARRQAFPCAPLTRITTPHQCIRSERVRRLQFGARFGFRGHRDRAHSRYSRCCRALRDTTTHHTHRVRGTACTKQCLGVCMNHVAPDEQRLLPPNVTRYMHVYACEKGFL
jgi:hypothetical protein